LNHPPLVNACLILYTLYHPLFYLLFCLFFFNDTPTTDIYTLSLHDALPILDFVGYPRFPAPVEFIAAVIAYYVHPVNIISNDGRDRKSGSAGMPRPISYAVFCLKKKKNNQLTYSTPI